MLLQRAVVLFSIVALLAGITCRPLRSLVPRCVVGKVGLVLCARCFTRFRCARDAGSVRKHGR